MQCRVCGDENNVSFRNRSGWFLCNSCHRDTPRKASREDFDLIYWEGQAESVPASTRQAFWEDYRASNFGPITSYIDATRESLGV
jgi:hypothetical protein